MLSSASRTSSQVSAGASVPRQAKARSSGDGSKAQVRDQDPGLPVSCTRLTHQQQTSADAGGNGAPVVSSPPRGKACRAPLQNKGSCPKGARAGRWERAERDDVLHKQDRWWGQGRSGATVGPASGSCSQICRRRRRNKGGSRPSFHREASKESSVSWK